MVCCRPICVAGAFVTTAEPVEVIPPGNDRRPIAVTYHALEAEYEQAVEGALAAEEPLAALVAYERSAALHAVSRGILDRADELSRQLATEAGKADSRCAHRGRARCPHVPPRRRRGRASLRRGPAARHQRRLPRPAGDRGALPERETDYTFAAVKALANVSYSENDKAAAISSGSFLTRGMAIVPCSTKTLAGIATGFVYNLVCRAADVALKERRSLVLAVRETPLNSVHLRNMLTLSDLGATILPPTPSFYTQPAAIDDIVDYTVLRILDQFELGLESPSRWRGLRPPGKG